MNNYTKYSHFNSFTQSHVICQGLIYLSICALTYVNSSVQEVQVQSPEQTIWTQDSIPPK